MNKSERCNNHAPLARFVHVKPWLLLSVVFVTCFASADVTLSSSAMQPSVQSMTQNLTSDDSFDSAYQTSFDDTSMVNDDIDAVVDEQALMNLNQIDDEADQFSITPGDAGLDEFASIEDATPSTDVLDAKINSDPAQFLWQNNTDNALNKEAVAIQAPLNAISIQTIQRFVEIIDLVRQDYVTSVSDETLFEYAIQGMLEKLDRHSAYLSPLAYERLREFTEGEIASVGLSFERSTDAQSGWRVSEVDADSTAHAAHIMVGDDLLQIKGKKVSPLMQAYDLNQLLSGVAGSQVVVTVKHNADKHTGSPHGQIKHHVLQRDDVMNTQLQLYVQNGIVVITLPVFQNNTKAQLLSGLKQIDTQIYGVVIDVRGNPGGVLSAAVDVASLFVADNPLIEVSNRVSVEQTIKPNGRPLLIDLPVAIIQNEHSASAAEILASAIQNNGGVVVGKTSYGKGSVQEILPLMTGGALKLTVAKYRSRFKDNIDGVGVKPDVVLDTAARRWQQQTIDLLRQDITSQSAYLIPSNLVIDPIGDY